MITNWQREDRLTKVARAAGCEGTSVFINEQPEGSH